MFESLTERLSSTLRFLSKNSKLTDENIKDTLKEIKKSLLDADVALPVVRSFIDSVRTDALGQKIDAQFSPSQFFVKIVNDKLVRLMGHESQELSFQAAAPVVYLVAGLQGSGKTTTCAKLAKYIQEEYKKSVMTVSCDIHRPAAIDQLQTVSGQVGAAFFPSTPKDKPADIVTAALAEAKRSQQEVLIIDTAGRMHIDEDMMNEVCDVAKIANPHETLFVVDSMTGQDAANTAKAFDERLDLTGVILTKADGDTRGGAALSIKYITSKPIKFIGVGEKLDALEVFHPDRIASRILGMGDMLSLIEEIEKKVDKDKAEKLAKKIARGRGFDLSDLRDQLLQMKNMGGLTSMLDKLPGAANLPQHVKDQANNKDLDTMIAVINSMTPKERLRPALIRGSRKSRIAKGAGVNPAAVNKVLKQHTQMEKMMKKMSSKGGMMNMLKGMQDRLPPGIMPDDLIKK